MGGIPPPVGGSAPTCPPSEEKMVKISHFWQIFRFLPLRIAFCPLYALHKKISKERKKERKKSKKKKKKKKKHTHTHKNTKNKTKQNKSGAATANRMLEFVPITNDNYY